MSDYQPNLTDYKCHVCGATNLKLWRMFASFSRDLLCAHCAALDEHLDVVVDNKGTFKSWTGSRTDQIGSYVPCVPDEDGNYWGYTSVPDDAIAWWRGLPTYDSDASR